MYLSTVNKKSANFQFSKVHTKGGQICPTTALFQLSAHIITVIFTIHLTKIIIVINMVFKKESLASVILAADRA